MHKHPSKFLESDPETQTRTLLSFVKAYHADEALRSRAETEPRAVLAENGIDLPHGREIRIVANTAEHFHVALPSDPNADLADEDLDAATGGKTVGSPSGGVSVASTLATAGIVAG